MRHAAIALLVAMVLCIGVDSWWTWRFLALRAGGASAVAPEMVTLEGGTFTMGSPKGEEGRDDDEGPQHEVPLATFAIGKHEVTFDEWDLCVADAGCAWTDDDGWGRGRRPVINVSWDDAQAYVTWLSRETGQPYRLPSEGEWEYAARAKTTTRYSWGDDPPTPEQANFGRNVSKTTEVGSYPANPWGLYDMQGNVWEWVEDCYHDSYAGAPNNGSAWTKGNCIRRVRRGGSWGNGPDDLRSASRDGFIHSFRNFGIGFRVAKDAPLNAEPARASSRSDRTDDPDPAVRTQGRAGHAVLGRLTLLCAVASRAGRVGIP